MNEQANANQWQQLFPCYEIDFQALLDDVGGVVGSASRCMAKIANKWRGVRLNLSPGYPKEVTGVIYLNDAYGTLVQALSAWAATKTFANSVFYCW